MTNLSSHRELIDTPNPAPPFEFAAICIASIVLWWHPLRATLSLALHNDSFTYLLLILPISVFLILAERSQSPASYSGPSRAAGGMLLLGALFLRVLAFWGPLHLSASDALTLSVFALVLCWIGSVIVCFGSQVVRSHFFAFCFLFLLVPLPDGVVNWVVGTLQTTSAVAADALFRIARVPVARDGIVLSIPGLDIQVARECSSVRSSTMLVVLTLLLAHLFLRSKWRKILLVVLAVPLSIAKNAVRIFTIAELATRVDPSYLYGKLHHQGGVVFLGLAVLVTILFLWFLRKSELQAAQNVSVK